jgi:hypothetical protein
MGKALLKKKVKQCREWDVDDHMTRKEVAASLNLTLGQVRRAETTGLNKLYENKLMRAWADER